MTKFGFGLDHPCRDVCSGWQQGYERGFQEGRVRLFEAILKQGFNRETQDWIRSRAMFEANKLSDMEKEKEE